MLLQNDCFLAKNRLRYSRERASEMWQNVRCEMHLSHRNECFTAKAKAPSATVAALEAKEQMLREAIAQMRRDAEEDGAAKGANETDHSCNFVKFWKLCAGFGTISGNFDILNIVFYTF